VNGRSAVDALLEASVVGSFSRIGLAVRGRMLPEFTTDTHPPRRGRVAVVTGATSGLGRATATELARRGMTVHFLARDAARAAQAQREIEAAGARAAAAAGAGDGEGAGAGPEVTFGIADMDDLDSVRGFTMDALGRHGRIDVLIHNAGTMHEQYRQDKSGLELTVVGHVLAPFLLTHLLMPALRAAAPSRVITVSSGGMYGQRLDPSALIMPAHEYNGVTAYARAKRAQVALNREWARRLTGTGVSFHAMHPGWADTPGLVSSLPRFHRLMKPILRSPEQGADTIVWLATAPASELGSGQFWHDRRPRSEYLLPWTHDASPAAARELWAWAASQTGV
jgi:dehydrogenase/reductase SDR family member 12